ncbi:hypothetical protein PSUB009319_00700 [Ralstonia sp. SET104]|nr:hypothetical protein PSUB009319_00700 [Ralstonia sp. SET104]
MRVVIAADQRARGAQRQQHRHDNHDPARAAHGGAAIDLFDRVNRDGVVRRGVRQVTGMVPRMGAG